VKSILAAAFLFLGLIPMPGLAGHGGNTHMSPTHEDENDFDSENALAISQAAVGRVIGDATFTDASGKTVRLSDFRGTPLVISLIYSSCAHACPLITETLGRAVETAREAMGADSFRVVSIGFDVPTDTPQRMGQFAKSHGVGDEGWLFLSADAPTIAALGKELGFIFKESPKGFDHLSQVTVADAEGRVTNQIYGEDFSPPHLVEPLKNLIYGTGASFTSFEGVANRVKLFCTVYDPASGRYRFDYSLFVGMAIGGICIGGTLIFLVRSRRRRSKDGSP